MTTQTSILTHNAFKPRVATTDRVTIWREKHKAHLKSLNPLNRKPSSLPLG